MRNTLGGLRPWLRDRPLLADAVVAVLLAVAAVSSLRLPLAQDGSTGPGSPGWPALTLLVLGCLATVLRGSRPLAALGLVLTADLTLALLGADGSVLGFAALWLVYTVAARRGLALSLGALTAAFAGRLAAAAARGDLADWTSQLFEVVLTVTCWLVGRSLRLRHAYLAELRDRADRLERAREADTRAARAEERSRIARELHDVVAHHVSVMTVQAAAARRVLANNPDGAREALSAIEHTGRAAMAEMRGIVGVLRTESTPAEREPRPGVRSIPSLAAQMSEAGLRTRLRFEEVDGAGRIRSCADADGDGDGDADRDGIEGGREHAPPLPPGVDLAAYRLVQEALTNSLRHAGPGARAWVTVRRGPGELTVRVEDDGRGPVPVPEGERSGHGLVGIRERVALYGGILRIGPRSEGGFEVDARFPLKDAR
ncbi:two-component sensor histidine kinase [Planomonospora parontospora subsp. parontospora]|uniref:histidine kinase n=2 Tax=Planomonospora parontospora TaxID=58119 RepID=A0AA37BGB9_9ACTN|nr:histidine kinase [Planomonospora parontospora]GGK66828.1 two-component sensor histidine kinase [Planomonospora parontospora]GII08549.1 two-component sensor histidine kinase [Planomonospora parontospora subsp. parontospora]